MFHTCPRGKTVLFVRGPICLDLNDISNFPPAYTKNTATMRPSITSSYLSLITLLFHQPITGSPLLF